jgi:hypothetical protein
MELLSFGIPYQVTSFVGAAQRGVHILSRMMAFFNMTKKRFIQQYFTDFMLHNMVLSVKLLDNFINPDDAFDFQACHPDMSSYEG